MSLLSGLQKPGRRTRSRSTPAFTAAVSTTRAIYSERLTDQVRDALAVGSCVPRWLALHFALPLKPETNS